uniref:EF-hand domain-containing protein n=1 Tax=Eutreptiella gymnastica TaxID=73025 RepID=A0A6U7XH93_9EUGL
MAPMVNFVTENEEDILDFVDGVEIPGIRFGVQDHRFFCWVAEQYRGERRNGYGLTSMQFDPHIIRSLLMAGSHIPMGFDYTGKVVLLVIEPPCPSSKVQWQYVSCDLPTGVRDLSRWLDECAPLPLGVRGIVDFDTLHLWVPIPRSPQPIRRTHLVKQFRCANTDSALEQVSQVLEDGNIFLDFSTDGVATYIEITPGSGIVAASSPTPNPEPVATNLRGMASGIGSLAEPLEPSPSQAFVPLESPIAMKRELPKSPELEARPAPSRPVWSNGTLLPTDLDPEFPTPEPSPHKAPPKAAAAERCKSPSRLPGMSLSSAFMDEPDIPIEPPTMDYAQFATSRSGGPNKAMKSLPGGGGGGRMKASLPLAEQMDDADVEDDLFSGLSKEFAKYRLSPSSAAPRKGGNKSLPGARAMKAMPGGALAGSDWGAEEQPPEPPAQPKNYFKARAAVRVPPSEIKNLFQRDAELHEAAGIHTGTVMQTWMQKWEQRGKPNGNEELKEALAQHAERWEDVKKPSHDSWALPHMMDTFDKTTSNLTRNMMVDEIQEKMDANGDAMLDKNEFGNMYTELFGKELSPQLLDDTYSRADTDKNGKCNFRELMIFLEQAAKDRAASR